MSQTLRDVISKFLTREGNAGMAKLCEVTDKSDPTIRRWLKEGVPTQRKAYKLAVAAGCTDEEALKLAHEECPSEDGREAG